MSELRHDPLRDHWVVVAEERALRPRTWVTATAAGPVAPCPFCPGHESETPPEVYARRAEGGPDTPGWRVRVVPNKYPALAPPPAGGDPPLLAAGGPLPGHGGHEVVIDAPDHERDLADQPVEQVAEALAAYRDRARTWLETPGTAAVALFRNAGARAGATMAHPHGQLLALPLVPPAVVRERERAALLAERHRTCPTCRALAEAGEGGRLVERTPMVAVFSPFAARFPYEVWILPVAHAPAFTGAGDDLLFDVAVVLRRTLRAMREAAGTSDHNWFLLAALPGAAEAAHHHWRLELFPKVSHLAGFETGSGMYLNVVSPERAAARLAAALA